MPLLQSQGDLDDGFNRTELAALESARENGWLTLSPAIGDRVLAVWQRECELSGNAFAVVRLESMRASLWFLLTTAREWTQMEQVRILAALANTTGFVVTSNNVRAFARLGVEAEVMRQLLAANANIH